MIINLRKGTTVKQVKKQFHERFPYLKLEFFVHTAGEHNDVVETFADDSMKLGELQPLMRETSIAITDFLKVCEFECMLKQKCLLDVQVFRRSGSLWLDTTMTDGWTLSKQNEHGEEITETFYSSAITEYDFETDPDQLP